MPGPLVVVETDEVVLYAEVRCRACFAPHLIRTSGERPRGPVPAGRLYIRQRRYERLTFQCGTCDHLAAELVDVTEAQVHVTRPQPDPHPDLARPRLFLCEALP